MLHGCSHASSSKNFYVKLVAVDKTDKHDKNCILNNVLQHDKNWILNQFDTPTLHFIGFKRADDIVFEIESMQQANARIKNTDWYVHGRLHRGLCTWKYEGRISSPTQGFTTLSMESYIGKAL